MKYFQAVLFEAWKRCLLWQVFFHLSVYKSGNPQYFALVKSRTPGSMHKASIDSQKLRMSGEKTDFSRLPSLNNKYLTVFLIPKNSTQSFLKVVFISQFQYIDMTRRFHVILTSFSREYRKYIQQLINKLRYISIKAII